MAVWVSNIAAGIVFSALAGAQVPVCLDDRVGLSPFTRKAFEAEFRDLSPNTPLKFVSEECPSTAVSLVVSAYPPARYTSALGLAHRSRERILPELRIFTQPVLRIIGEQAGAAQLGRALARVAAHETGHYLLQQLHHDDEGLMRQGFEKQTLAAKDSTYFRKISR